MTNFAKKSLAVIGLSVLATGAAIAQEESTAVFDYSHKGEQYPPVFFVNNVEDQSFVDKMVEYQAFEKLDEKSVGLPIGVRVLKGHRTKQDGTQFSTLMLSASTLGIIPIVSNTEFKVRYDVFVQGKSIATFEYAMDSTDVNNLWTSAYKDHEIKPSEELFLKDTVAQFLNELTEEDEVQAVFAEYREYFD